jgi:beta-xylosidase
MKKLLVVMTLCGMAFIIFAQPVNNAKFQPGQIWTDNNGVHINAHGGGILYDSDTYYWFGEHKIAGSEGNKAQVGVHCYSSKDLYNWKDEGIALPVDTLNESSEITKGCVLERPKVVFNKKSGKYVMWFHLELKDRGYEAARCGVAVSDKVTGPYQYLRSYRPNANKWPMNATAKDTLIAEGGDSTLLKLPGKETAIAGYFLRRDYPVGQMARDMTIFQDDDKAYLIYASEENYTMNISELSDDYTLFTGRWYRLFPGGHNEAPAIFKVNGKYYLITSGCTGWAPNAARSAVASSIFGPWKELGNPCAGQDSALTFHSQSTYALKVQGKENAFIFMADRWMPENPINGRYIWLPIEFTQGKIILRWKDEWDMNFFNKN